MRDGPVANAFERFATALDKVNRGEISDENVRNVWISIADVLAAYTSEKNDVKRGTPIEQFPPHVAVIIDYALRGIISGNIPDSLSIFLKRGAPSATPFEIDDKKSAVLYLEAVRAGLICDKSPNKTVCELFTVSSQTVRDWRNQLPVSLDDFLPSASPGDRAEIIESRARKAGERFSKAGGGRQAIENRPPAK